MKISIFPLKGERPGIAAHRLDDVEGQYAYNANFSSTHLASIPGEILEEDTVEKDINSLYRWRYGAASYQFVTSESYLQFVKAPLAADSFYRAYYSGAAELRYLSNDIMSTPFDLSTDFKKLGIPAPASAITSAGTYTPNGGYRAYVYTYVSRYGEEGPPSGILSIVDYGSGNVVLTGFSQPPADRGLRTKVGTREPYIRIYRTNASGVGTAEFQYVGEFKVVDVVTWSTHTFTDDVSDSNLGEVLPSTDWLPPPAGLDGIVLLPNGSIAGFKNNEVWFSEPYLPHAWPTAYQMVLEHDVVALGVLGTTLVVLTESFPFYLAGPLPGEMEKIKIPGLYPCKSKTAVVSTEFGVVYPSSDGIVLIDHNGAKIISLDVFDREVWENHAPTTFKAVFWNHQYFVSCVHLKTGSKGFFFDFRTNTVVQTRYFYAFFVDLDNTLYTVRRSNPNEEELSIYTWGTNYTSYLVYEWKSKEFLIGNRVHFSVARISPDMTFWTNIIGTINEISEIITHNESVFGIDTLGGTLNEDDINVHGVNDDLLISVVTYSVTSNILFRIFVDGVLTYSKTIDASVSRPRPFKLPSKVSGRKVQVYIAGQIPIAAIELATGVRELMGG